MIICYDNAMEYKDICKGKFIERPNRFIAHVEIDGKPEAVHVKNTGRCRELLIPGATVFVEDHTGRMGTRKLRYSLIVVEKRTAAGCITVNVDSQAPNKVIREALFEGKLAPEGLEDISVLKSEHKYGESRLDFYGEDASGRKWLAEVKGVTLEENGLAKFPDAPTERGVRHIEELIRAVSEGYRASVIFVIQMKGIHAFSPNDETHPRFGEALRKAKMAGVEILAVDCIVERNALRVDAPIPALL